MFLYEIYITPFVARYITYIDMHLNIHSRHQVCITLMYKQWSIHGLINDYVKNEMNKLSTSKLVWRSQWIFSQLNNEIMSTISSYLMPRVSLNTTHTCCICC